jgi:antitoxin VapB
VALNIRDKETEALVAQIASLTGETKTDAVRTAARERLDRMKPRLTGRPRTAEEMRTWLETEIWPLIPDNFLDREPMTKAEREELLGYGPGGF